MRWLLISVVLVACGDSSHVGDCGSYGEECCFYPDGTVGCHNDPRVIVPTQDSLACKGYPGGARYCVHCGFNGQPCCPGMRCVLGLGCSADNLCISK